MPDSPTGSSNDLDYYSMVRNSRQGGWDRGYRSTWSPPPPCTRSPTELGPQELRPAGTMFRRSLEPRVDIFFATRVGVPEIREPHKCTELVWVDPARLPDDTLDSSAKPGLMPTTATPSGSTASPRSRCSHASGRGLPDGGSGAKAVEPAV